MRRIRRSAYRLLTGLLAVGLAAVGPAVTPPAVGATTPTPVSVSAPPIYSVTFVARVCDGYSQVMANLARNDIQESLQDLGKDTVYRSGQPIDPSIEDPQDPACRPLDGWKFDLGTGYRKAGALSTVTGRLATAGPTADDVPQLNAQGDPTGGTLDGAVTLQLTAAQVADAAQGRLWAQGGLQDDPLMTGATGQGTYGFAALRCAVDNVNGDNVETVAFPSSSTHVYCYAYYVSPEPGSGSITVTKRVAGQGAVASSFTFASDLTYNPSGTFRLNPSPSAASSETFLRADSASYGKPYTVTEQVPDGWQLTDLTCTVTRPGGGTPTTTTTTDLATATATIDLGSQDAVTCTYTDEPPQTAGLTVRKVTEGRAGGPFDFTVHNTGDPSVPDLTGSATTTAPEAPVTAVRSDSVPAGDYTVTETLPRASGGHWVASGAFCNGSEVPVHTDGHTASVSLHVETGQDQDCTFSNTWVPAGVIKLYLRTIGGTGSGQFFTTPVNYQVGEYGRRGYHQLATTAAPEQDRLATGEATDRLSLRPYDIVSVGPRTTIAGRWEFVSFTCDHDVTQEATPAHRAVRVALTPEAPDASCTAVYRLIPSARLDLVKTVDGPARLHPGPVVVEIRCRDGAFGRAVLPAGGSGPARLPEDLRFLRSTRCTVTEPRTGAGRGVRVATTGGVAHAGGIDIPGGSRLPLAFDVDAARSGYLAAVHDVYTPPPAPRPAPAARPHPGPAPHPQAAGLAATGTAPAVFGAALAAVLALAAGIVLTARRRRG